MAVSSWVRASSVEKPRRSRSRKKPSRSRWSSVAASAWTTARTSGARRAAWRANCCDRARVHRAGLPAQGPVGLVCEQALGHDEKNMVRPWKDLEMFEEEVVEVTDAVTIRFRVETTYVGDFLHWLATGRRVSFHAVRIVTISDGKDTGQWPSRISPEPSSS
jgi:hypothetical protein